MSLPVFAISEKNYQRDWDTKVVPFFKTMSSGTFKNPQGLSLHYYYLLKPHARKTMVILPGRTEPTKKYAEWIYDLNSPDVNFFLLDHQGQGESSRIFPGSSMGHVDKFENYVTDFTQFMNQLVIPLSRGTELVLLAHSMGSSISALYMKDHPRTFKKAVLNSPMMKINTFPLTEAAARTITSLMIKKNKGADYVPFFGPYEDNRVSFTFNPNTHSKARFEMTQSLIDQEPHLAVGGPSANWLHQCIKATKKIPSLSTNIETDILLFQAGLDIVVKKSRQTEFCSRALNCERRFYPAAYHEMLFEKDSIRDEIQNSVRSFLEI